MAALGGAGCIVSIDVGASGNGGAGTPVFGLHPEIGTQTGTGRTQTDTCSLTFYPTELDDGGFNGEQGFFSLTVKEKNRASQLARDRKTWDGGDFELLNEEPVKVGNVTVYDAPMQTRLQRGAQKLGAAYFWGWARRRANKVFVGQPCRVEASVWVFQPGKEEQKKKKEAGEQVDPLRDEPDLSEVAKEMALRGVAEVRFLPVSLLSPAPWPLLACCCPLTAVCFFVFRFFFFFAIAPGCWVS